MVRRQWLTADPCARIVGLRTAASTTARPRAKCDDHFSPSSPLRRNRSVREGEAVDNAFPTRQACASDPLHALLIATMVALVLSVSKRRQAHELCNFPTRRRRSNVNLPVTEVTRLFV